jgi:hypothetical protein
MTGYDFAKVFRDVNYLRKGQKVHDTVNRFCVCRPIIGNGGHDDEAGKNEMDLPLYCITHRRCIIKLVVYTAASSPIS